MHDLSSWHVLDLSPEPWAIGPLSVVRANGKYRGTVGRNIQLRSFQDSVREALGSQVMIAGKVKVTFYFWRVQAEYQSHQARTVRKHEADVTNMQKATEDALQGIFFENDKDVSEIRSVLVEQGVDVVPRIIINIEPWSGFDYAELPDDIYMKALKAPSLFTESDSNVWPPRA